MGPEGGDGGGMVVAEGTPEQVAEVEGSHTAEYLRPRLQPSVSPRVQTQAASREVAAIAS
jgi:excinuclease ABC subunit A